MNTDAATAKLSVLVPPATKRNLEAEARTKKTTVGALVRQRLSGETDGDEQAFMEALATLGERARAVITKLDVAHESMQRELAERPAREAEIRKTAIANLTSAHRRALMKIFAPPAGRAHR